MSYIKKFLLAGSAGILLLTTPPADAQTSGVLNYWTQASGNWNVPSNWSLGTLPNGQSTDDFAIIGGTSGANGVSTGAATIDSNITDMPGGITMGVAAADSGTLQISNGGSITAAVTGFNGDGKVYVGLSGTGTLNVDGGGSLSAVALNVSGNASSTIRLGTGSGTALVNVGDANLARTTRVVGPNVDFTSTNLNLTGGTLIDELTSSSHSALKATNTATLGGTLSIQFDPGVTAALGSTWNLINATNLAGGFTSVAISNAPSLPINQGYIVRKQAGGLGKIMQLAVEEQLVLNVDRATHVVSISNPGGSNIAIDGYSVHSTSLNELNTANFTPLGGTWQTANLGADRISQVNPSGSPTFAIGSTTSLGAIFSPPTPAAFGTPTEDLTFQYTQDDAFGGTTRTASVNYIGSTGINNLVLRVDPTTGATQLKNTSSFSEDIDGYTISSALGSLDTSQWNSLDDQNAAGGDWEEANISANRLSEIKYAGSTTFGIGQFFNIGNAFNEVLGKRDLLFQYLLHGESTPRTGVVVYESISASLQGDYNGDQRVDAADYVAWRMNPSAFGGPTGYTTWRTHYGETAGSGSGLVDGQMVPEPGSFTLFLIAAGMAFATILGRRSVWRELAVCR